MAEQRNDSIFWIEVDKISPNPYQPRHEFSEEKLRSLAESIRQYGVLQPLVATRKEEFGESGEGMRVTYELIAGERRLRAAKIAGLSQVPVVIRTGEDQDRMKLELAIIENLQREDLNPIDRAKAFKRLVEEFGFKHAQIAKSVGKSREYISNSIRLLSLPQEMQEALIEGKITEGHTRPILMLSSKPQEQDTLFREVVLKHLTVRETEAIARRAAIERVRKKELVSPLMIELERKLSDSLGTRVHIEQRDEGGGKILIDFFSPQDLQSLMERLGAEEAQKLGFLERFIPRAPSESGAPEAKPPGIKEEDTDKGPEGKNESDDDLYSVKNFSV